MEDMRSRGSVNRIKKCASDLLSMEDDLINDDDEELWELLGRDFLLKSTFLYCDLSQVISRASDEHKKTLTDLGNRLFHYMEELEHAVKSRNISSMQICYHDTALALQEILSTLVSSD